MNQKPLVVSFSGGRTSAFMARYLQLRYPNRQIIYVFANTSKERQETLDFVNECDTRWGLNVVWVEWRPKQQITNELINRQRAIARQLIMLHDPDLFDEHQFEVVTYETANRDGAVFREMAKRYGLPNKSYPHCSRELKINTINRYVKAHVGKSYETAIGIRADEAHRAKKDPNTIYPLIDEIKVDKLFIREWWAKQAFDLGLKDYEGNCDLCFKKSIRKKLTLIKENPDVADYWDNLEKEFGEDKWHLHQGGTSTAQLIELAKRPLRKAQDEFELHQELNRYSLFDQEYDCMCKST